MKKLILLVALISISCQAMEHPKPDSKKFDPFSWVRENPLMDAWRKYKKPIMLLTGVAIIGVVAFAMRAPASSPKQTIIPVDTFAGKDGLHNKLFKETKKFWNEHGSFDDFLFVFDIDETIFSHHPMYRATINRLKQEVKSGQLSREDLHAATAIAAHDHYIEAAHKKFPALIKNLQKFRIKTIALTAATAGPFGKEIPGFPKSYIENAHEFRIKQLSALDFDFNEHLATLNLTPGTSWNITVGDEYFFFHKGVLCTNNIKTTKQVKNKTVKSKGIVLYAFLDRLNSYYEEKNYKYWLPKKIIFVDDLHHYLESVKQAAQVLNIEYVGFHYTEITNKRKDGISKLSQEKVAHQAETLKNQHRWIEEH